MFSLWLFLPIGFSLLSGLNAAHLSSPRTVSELKYSRAHSLDDGYQFDARQGWESVNVTNLQYKYPRSITDLASTAGGNGALSSLKQLATDKSKIGKRKPSSSSITKSTLHFLNDVWNGLKGIGSLDTVKITWYTGEDLQNPSCWSKSEWAPTDDSFACALTLEGWTSKPKCFKFLELCNGPKKCVFVRVVDSCAGCDAGSKHVDLTKAAFAQLADLNDGILNVQMRLSTDPSPADWFPHLWGPKV